MTDERQRGSYRVRTVEGIAGALLIVALSIALSGCAIAVTNGVQTVPVTSVPEGAEVFVDGDFVGRTPLEIDLRRGREVLVLLRFEGQEREIVLGNALDATFVTLDVIPMAVAGLGTAIFCFGFSQVEDPIGALALSTLCLGGAGATLVAGTPIYVDAATGAWYNLTPEEISVTFE